MSNSELSLGAISHSIKYANVFDFKKGMPINVTQIQLLCKYVLGYLNLIALFVISEQCYGKAWSYQIIKSYKITILAMNGHYTQFVLKHKSLIDLSLDHVLPLH